MKHIEIILRKFLLKIFLFLFQVSINKDNRSFKNNPPKSILFIRLNRIGDALVTTPLFKLVREKMESKIFVLADSKNNFIYLNNDCIDEVIVFKKGIIGFFKTIKILNDKKIEVVFDLHTDVSTTVTYLIAALNCNYKFALTKETQKIYTRVIPQLNVSQNHIVDRELELLKLIGIQNYEKNLINIDYKITLENEKQAQNIILDYFNEKKFLVGINISAGSNARFWGMDRYSKLVEFFNQYDCNILLLSSPKDSKRSIEISAGRARTYFTEDFNLFAGLISKLNFLFTPDTSIVHLASAYETPMFGIYVKYKTNNMIWSPYKTINESIVTEDQNFEKLTYSEVEKKLKPFFEEIYSSLKHNEI